MENNQSKSPSSHSGPSRSWLMAIVVGLVLVSGIGIWYRSGAVPEGLDETYVTPRGAPEHIRVIEAQKAKIGEESLPEIIEQLFRDDQIYFSPGVQWSGIGRRPDFQTCLSSRRVVRLSHMVGELPDRERSRLLNDLSRRTYDSVRDTMENVIRMDAHPGWRQNLRSMLANEMAVVAYCWMAAHYQSVDEVLSQLQRLESYYAELKARVVNNDRLPSWQWLNLSGYAVPDNACQLNLLMVALEHDARVAPEDLERLRGRLRGLRRKKLEITVWDADVTSFDWPHVLEGVPVDRSKGVVQYQIYDWGRHESDEEFQQGILDEVKRFAGGVSSGRALGGQQ